MDDQNNIKKRKAIVLAFFQTVAEYMGIAAYLIFNLAFLVSMTLSVYDVIAHNGFDFEELVKKSLSSFELLFVAPIPILVIYAFRTTMTRIYPGFFKDPEDDPKNMLQLGDAKKTFISSMIGVLAIFILGQFFEIHNFLMYDFVKITLLFTFLVILILYYKLLSDHSEHS